MTRFAQIDAAEYALPDGLAAELASPALVVHLDRVRENLRRVVALLEGDPTRWRPHVKTTKIPAVWAEMARAGVRHFKCATTREARVLAQVLAAETIEDADVLLAYPLVGPALKELGRIAREFPAVRLSVLCEEVAAVSEVPEGVELFVDLNPGMDRTGVPIGEEQRVLAIARAAGSRFRGLHFYDGHRLEAELELRQRLAFEGYDRLLELADGLESAGIAPGELITSGTPAFLCALAYAPFRELGRSVHRVSPGTVVYHDLRSERDNPGLDLLPAAVVFARVSSRPRADVVTCDAGSKSIAAEAGDPCAFVLGRPELLALTPSEEHLPLRVRLGPAPPRGTGLYLVPRHICPTVNLAEEALLLDPGHAPTSAPVSARAHEFRYGAR